MNLLKCLSVAAVALSLSACGTITRGSNDTWVVETTPSGASVSTSNGFHCRSTPCGIRMPRRSEFVATIELEGYHTHEATVTYGASTGGGTAMAGNVLLGGIIGAGIDAGTGAMNDLRPNPLQVTLRPLPEASAVVSERAVDDTDSDASDGAEDEDEATSR
ncbi:MAG: PEGA domain-containing protein [Oceanicaulis sp.]|uniref:PEGA domain-containing protein n=1 Tax=Glycocaulis sp. TaxID=1969725 RepID=UPI00345BE733|nr:PEGA domain-containing protein [Oceanicaulis sp.]MCH8521182.1 PEGA domain-containing protein [Glycocaulis sp.]